MSYAKTYSERLSRRQLQLLAKKLYYAAFGAAMPHVNVYVASGFYLATDTGPIQKRLPLIILPPSSKAELIENLTHELVHHHTGWTRPHHGREFQTAHRRALRNLSKQAKAKRR